ncbi:MAG: TetR/AcrR family transcriptional regulator [Coriobacteriales bacterium]|jgi:AcrR family transcriptional regulator
MHKDNRRVRMTKRMIKDALLDLLDSQPIETVSVTALCKEADVSRSTFYLHYGSERDVISEIEEDLIEGIDQLFEQEAPDEEMPLGKQVVMMCHYFDEHRREAEAVFRSNTPRSEFAEKLLRMRVESQPKRYRFLESCNDAQKEVVTTFLCAGGFEALRSWLLHESDASPEEIGEAIEMMIAS